VAADAGKAPGCFLVASGLARLHFALGMATNTMKLAALFVFVGLMTHALCAADNEFPVYAPRTTVGGPRADKDFAIVDTPAYKGAIVPAEEAERHRYLAKHYKQFWTPTTNDIAKAEARLTAFIEASTDTHAAEIRKKLKRFRRQYVGYTADGERRVLCSFLPGVKRGQDPFAGLRRSFIKVYDGGPSFWEIHYRVEKDQCDGFRVDLGF